MYLRLYYATKLGPIVNKIYQSALREYANKCATLTGDERSNLKRPAHLTIMCQVAMERYKTETDEVKKHVREVLAKKMKQLEDEHSGRNKERRKAWVFLFFLRIFDA